MKQFLFFALICLCRPAIAQNVGIGTSFPSYRLHVVASSTAIYGSSTSGYGVYGTGSYGVYGYGSSYGVYGSSSYVGVYGSGTNYGLSGAGGTSGSYGVSGSGSYIGVFGESAGGTAVVGNSNSSTGGNFHSISGYGIIAGTNNADKNWAAVFNGNTYAYGTYQPSDKNLKKNIQVLGDAMSIINKLKPKRYEYLREGRIAKLDLPSGQHYGLIAQELEEVLPNLVKEIIYVGPVTASMPDTSLSAGKKTSITQVSVTDEKIVTKAINYTELIPVIIKAMQEQQATINKQNEKIEALTQMLNQLAKANKL